MNLNMSATPNGSVREPFAIVGIGCRFPGGCDDVDSFWKLLADGRSGICDVPPDRWNLEKFYSPTVGVPGTMVTRWGGFVGNLDRFDAGFWGVSPREAMRMDPQQRWLLEVAWEALEDSGAVPRSLRGKPVGVFIGIAGNDYAGLQMPNVPLSDVHTISGCTLSIAANRISYMLDLRGPSLSIDTACSSSLVALWSACQSISCGSCTSAIVCGVNAIITPEATIGFSKASMLSPTGCCFAFDERANGYVRGEGAGAIYIKPLSQALADGDRIYALIRSAVSNQDGHSSSMTVPSAESQAALLRQAYDEAGVSAAHVVYLEAHGTGTPVGDPIEATALGTVLRVGRAADQACLLGSVKTNIGHLEAGSGIAGVIKAALILHKDMIPPTLNYETPNSNIPLEELGLQIVTDLRPLPHNSGSAPVVGINSFGFGGANAHAVLEQAPPSNHAQINSIRCRPHILPISARNEAALRSFVESYCSLLVESPDALPRICYSAGARKEHHELRLAVIGQDATQMRQRLGDWLREPESAAGVVLGRASAAASGPVFVFTGQGAQWHAMGRQLLQRESVFSEKLTEIDGLLQPLTGWSLLEELRQDESTSKIDRTDVAQPALFALQVGLSELWQSWGVTPSKVIGHSVGEVAAACVAGIYSLADAVKVIFERSRLQHTTAGRGRMLAAGISAAEAMEAIGTEADRVQIAAMNGPSQVTLSGDTGVLEDIAQRVERTGKFVRWLRIHYAFHSYHMDPIKDELVLALGSICAQAARIPFISTVTGTSLAGERLNADYWWKNVRRPVSFAPALAAIIGDNNVSFLEVGPHPALAASITECLSERSRTGQVFHSLRRGTDESQEMLVNLAGLHVAGTPLDWAEVNQSSGPFLRLPHYPWQRESFWLESKQSRQARLAPLPHPLLGEPITAAQPTWQVDLHLARFAFLNDHRLWDSVVFPAACYAEIGIALGRLLFPDEPHAVEDLIIAKALFLNEDRPTTALVVFEPETKNFRIYSSVEGDAWSLNARGCLMRFSSMQQEPIDPQRIRQRLPNHYDHDQYYKDMTEAGYQFGPRFKQLRNVWWGSGEALAEVVVPETVLTARGDYHLHPAVLDACFQIFKGLDPSLTKADFFLPQSIGRVHLHSNGTPARLWAHGRLLDSDGQKLRADILVYDDQGRPFAQVRALHLDRAEQKQSLGGEPNFYHFRWQPGRWGASGVQGSCHFPPATDIVSAARAKIGEDYREYSPDKYNHQFAPRVDRLISQSVWNAWMQLGWRPFPGERFTAMELIDRLGITAPHHRLFLAQLRAFNACDYLRATGEDAWEVVQVSPHDVTSGDWVALTAEYPLCAAEIALHRRVAPRLANVLSGSIDPKEVLFPGGSTELLERFYTEGADFPTHVPLIREALARLLERVPDQRVIRVLEIGGGTGSFTRMILPLLPAERSEYLFTDISRAFLMSAKNRFADCSHLDYRIFDIEKAPEEQGVAVGGFDLIVGSLVLHATADLKQSLANLRSCLAPGGLLLFLEVFPRRTSWNNIFGLLEGWWRFTDTSLRRHSPLLEREQWLTLLGDCGFVDSGTFSSQADEREAELAFLFAFAPSEEVKANHSVTISSPGNFVVLADAGGLGDALAERMTRQGHRAVCVRADSATETELLGDLSSMAELTGVVHCWSLDHRPAHGMSLEGMWAAQETGVLSAFRLIRGFAARRGEASRDISAPELPNFWFVTRDVRRVKDADRALGLASAPLTGLLRVANNELFPARLVQIDLDSATAAGDADNLYWEIVLGDGEREVAYRSGRRHVHRLERVLAEQLEPKLGNAVAADGRVVPFRLQTNKAGVLNNLSLNETRRRAPEPDEVEIRIRAGGINFRDVLKALGTYPGNTVDRLWFGDDVSGVVERVGANIRRLRVGDEVAGMVPYGFQAYVTADARMLFPKPVDLSFEQAATLPTVFLTSHYALCHLARMQPGEKILIHAGTGGVGQAAIQIARCLSLEIFATAGTPEKRRLLLELGAHHAMSSRTLEFADEIMGLTDGRGVDCVLNSLAGDFVPKSLSVLAPYGRFLEIGKIDIYRNAKIGLEALRNNISYFAIDLGQLWQTKPEYAATLLQELRERFEAGDYCSLQHSVFPVTQVVDAFRYMAQGKHVGKNVLTFDAACIPIGPCTQDAHRFHDDATYLITGGAGGFGLELAKWLCGHGARHIVLLSRSGPKPGQAENDIEQLQSAGAKVWDFRGDVSRWEDVKRTVARIGVEMPPLKGLIHAAMVLEDDFLAVLDDDRFKAALAPKMAGAWNLHLATAELDLDHFICMSSASCVAGFPKQGNYNAGNSFLDALAEYRQGQGLPALSIGWGALLGAGFVERNRATAEYLSSIGLGALNLDEALAVFGQLTLTRQAHVAACRVDWRALSKVCPMVGESGLYSRLTRENADAQQGGSLLARLQLAKANARLGLLEDFIAAQVSSVFGTHAKVERETSLANLGLDSLLALELANRLQREIGKPIPMANLLGGPSVKSVAESLLRLLTQAESMDRPTGNVTRISPATTTTELPSGQDPIFRIQSGAQADSSLAEMRCDGAALTYLPDKLVTVGGLTDNQLRAMFGNEPFVSHFYEMSLGNIAVVMLPFRSHALHHQEEVRGPIVRAIELAGKLGALCVSLTGLIPSLTNYGRDIVTWLGHRTNVPVPTTGHATTTAAVIRNLQNMLQLTGRELERESLAVLGLGSIGQSCLRLLLEVCPHPRELVLCDVFAKEDLWQRIAEVARNEHGYRGSIRMVSSDAGAPAEVYEASTILTAVSVPNILSVARMRPGTIVVDDSYPPAFQVDLAMQRAHADGDVFFSNAGMLRLVTPIRETVLVPAAGVAELAQFGVAAFREESLRDPRELTACVLSSLLTGQSDGGFPPTLGLAQPSDLVSHYRALERIKIGPARPQCDKYFYPEEALRRFCLLSKDARA